MNLTELERLELKTFTEQDVLDSCSINNINTNSIIALRLSYNNIKDISGIKLFKNLKALELHNNKIKDISVIKDLTELTDLYIGDNKITNISVIKYLKNLKFLNIEYLKLESNQIKYIKSLKNLKTLYCTNKGFKDKYIYYKLFNKKINII